MTVRNAAAVTRELERLMRGAGRRIRKRFRAASKPAGVEVQLVMDSADLVNWRSHDEQVSALRFTPTGTPGAPIDSPRRAADGPPHGALRLERLAPQEYAVSAIRDGRPRRIAPPERAARATPHGTDNIAVSAEGTVWEVVDDPVRGVMLRSRSAAEAARGIRELKAMHGMVALVAGPVDPGVLLQLERRGTKEVREVPAVSHAAGGLARYRLGAAQWAEAVKLSDQEHAATSVWNLYLVDPAAPERRERLRWTGSRVSSPRDVLRYRATASLMVPGRKVEIRPYWTKDQYLALEVKVAASIEGELA